ncbi:DegV family protein [Priestia abyssalis]|uniref:DegV family protein n=1 Tax=Priestia abyssalis TaxID=1221450 RepID=UPI0009959139|nr:DegV family protein [Priestia abyssalis]
MKTAIVTDSTAYIPKELRDELNIHMIPLSVIFGQETYREEIDMTNAQFYEKVREQLPTTSQPPIGEFVNLFETLAKDYDAAVVVTLSSGISGTYQGAVSAGQMVEGIDVYTFDSEISAMIQGFYVLEAAKMAKQDKTPQEILTRLNEMKQSMKAYIMVDDLSHLQRGGRLNAAQAFVGSLLQVKPIVHFVDGKIVPFEKIRTRKKALKRIFDLLGEVASEGAPMKASVIHANHPEEGEEIKAELERAYPNVEFSLSYFGPVIGTHLGEGAIGIGWYKK